MFQECIGLSLEKHFFLQLSQQIFLSHLVLFKFLQIGLLATQKEKNGCCHAHVLVLIQLTTYMFECKNQFFKGTLFQCHFKKFVLNFVFAKWLSCLYCLLYELRILQIQIPYNLPTYIHSCFNAITFVQLYCCHFCHSEEKQEKRDGDEDQFLWKTIEMPHSKVKSKDKHLCCCCCTHKCRLCFQQLHKLKYGLFHGHFKNPSKTHFLLPNFIFLIVSNCICLFKFVSILKKIGCNGVMCNEVLGLQQKVVFGFCTNFV